MGQIRRIKRRKLCKKPGVRKTKAKNFYSINRDGIGSSLKGVNMQKLLYVISILETYEKGKSFQNYTEVDEEEPVADIVANCFRNTWCVQSKYSSKQNNLQVNDFSYENLIDLAKYLKKILKDKNEDPDKKKYAFCTNRSISSSHDNEVILKDTNGNAIFTFTKCTKKFKLYKNYGQHYKLNENCPTTVANVKNYVEAAMKKKFNKEKQALKRAGKPSKNPPEPLDDKDVIYFMKEFVLVFDVKKDVLEKKVKELLQDVFGLSAPDSQYEVLMNKMCSFYENLVKAEFFTFQKTKELLEKIKDETLTKPQVLGRSADLFRRSEIVFETDETFIASIKNAVEGPNRLFYIEVKKGDTLYASYKINQQLKLKKSDDFLFLVTKLFNQFENGLRWFSDEICFNTLAVVESRKHLIAVEDLEEIKKILSDNPNKRALIITEDVSKYAANIKENNDNLIKIEKKFKVADLTPESKKLFLIKFIKHQSLLKLATSNNPDYHNLLDDIDLKWFEKTQFIGNYAFEGKRMEIDEYMQKHFSTKSQVILSVTRDKKSDESYQQVFECIQKKKFPHDLNIYINFDDHAKYLESQEFNNEKDVKIFIVNEILKSKDNNEMQFFHIIWNEIGLFQFVFVADSKYSDKMLKIMKIITQMKHSGVFIFSRPELKSALIDEFKPFISVVPMPTLSEEDKENIFVKYLCNKYGEETIDMTRAFAKRIISFMNKMQWSKLADTSIVLETFADILPFNASDAIIEKIDYSDFMDELLNKIMEQLLNKKTAWDLSKPINKNIFETLKNKLTTYFKSYVQKQSQNSEQKEKHWKELTGYGLSDDDIKNIFNEISYSLKPEKHIDDNSDEGPSKPKIIKLSSSSEPLAIN